VFRKSRGSGFFESRGDFDKHFDKQGFSIIVLFGEFIVSVFGYFLQTQDLFHIFWGDLNIGFVEIEFSQRVGVSFLDYCNSISAIIPSIDNWLGRQLFVKLSSKVFVT
jgi:hypothetical protein